MKMLIGDGAFDTNNPISMGLTVNPLVGHPAHITIQDALTALTTHQTSNRQGRPCTMPECNELIRRSSSTQSIYSPLPIHCPNHQSNNCWHAETLELAYHDLDEFNEVAAEIVSILKKLELTPRWR